MNVVIVLGLLNILFIISTLMEKGYHRQIANESCGMDTK